MLLLLFEFVFNVSWFESFLFLVSFTFIVIQLSEGSDLSFLWDTIVVWTKRSFSFSFSFFSSNSDIVFMFERLLFLVNTVVVPCKDLFWVVLFKFEFVFLLEFEYVFAISVFLFLSIILLLLFFVVLFISTLFGLGISLLIFFPWYWNVYDFFFSYSTFASLSMEKDDTFPIISTSQSFNWLTSNFFWLVVLDFLECSLGCSKLWAFCISITGSVCVFFISKFESLKLSIFNLSFLLFLSLNFFFLSFNWSIFCSSLCICILWAMSLESSSSSSPSPSPSPSPSSSPSTSPSSPSSSSPPSSSSSSPSFSSSSLL